MRRYHSFACIPLIIFTILIPIWTPILPFSLFCLFEPSNLTTSNVLLMLIIALFGWSIGLLFYRNAYCIFEMNEKGIRNSKLMIPWEKITEIDIIETRLLQATIIFNIHITIVCIGCFESKKFWNLKSQECIFFHMSQKNLLKMETFSKGQSKIVNEFLEKYRHKT